MRPRSPQSAFGCADARTVDGAVQPTERRDRRGDRVLHAVLLSDIGMHKFRFAAQFGSELLARRVVHISDEDLRAYPNEAPRTCRAQARGAASDEKDVSMELHLQQRTCDRASAAVGRRVSKEGAQPRSRASSPGETPAGDDCQKNLFGALTLPTRRL